MAARALHTVLAGAVFALAASVVGADDFGNADKGKTVFNKCKSCHQLGEGARNRVGPHLNGIFGRKAGGLEGFRYSEGLIRLGDDGVDWDIEHLDAYLENPKALVSGTRMNFRGLKDKDDRADVIAYLRVFSDNPSDVPEAAPTAQPREVELSEETLAIVGDPDYGNYLSSECTTCHQTDGQDTGIPSITGWPEEDFVVAMHAYKVKVRPHPVMQMMTARLTDEEIAALAAYFASLN